MTNDQLRRSGKPMKNYKPAIYFHVGLGKVASTFLQYRFFPNLKGICYIQRTKYRRSPEIIQQNQFDRYLISREFDRQLPDEVEWFSQFFPDAKPIILLRRHDQWIASQYRRYLKNGGHLKFEEFLDLKHDKGWWKLNEVYFMPYIKALEEKFSNTPLLLFYEDFKADPRQFFDILAHYMQATYNWSAIDLRPFHTAYSDKQLKFIRKYGSPWFSQDKPEPRNPVVKWVMRRAEMLKSYIYLYAALLAPDFSIAQEVLYPSEYMQQIREFYQADWEACCDYASRNPLMETIQGERSG